MKFTLSWLKKFLDTSASLNEIVNKLTMLGLEVEEVTDRAAELADFEVAEIIETAEHPDANKLKICKVRTTTGILQIVCGAPNARVGIKVVLAKVGALIPNGSFKIKQSKIRGIDSSGMLCSAEELNIKGDSTGIIELPDNLQIGDKISQHWGLDDPVIHINVTPNRADALGVYGIARDLAAAGMGQLLHPNTTTDTIEGSTVLLENKEDTSCALFAARTIKNISNINSPVWLKHCLENIGVASISPVVDITNYICYTYGQPMHAYDARKLKGDLLVETLAKTTNFIALNNKEYELVPGDIVIRDDSNVHCLAGIIGAQDSACDSQTTQIVLESGCFDSKYIARTGRRLMIDTDSRYRFERNVDRAFTLHALNLATDLIVDICGGEVVDTKVVRSDELPIRKINFSSDFLASRAGFTIEKDEVVKILEGLGFIISYPIEIVRNVDVNNQDNAYGISIQIPSWRSDITIKEDIVEEILRIYGYDKIPMVRLPVAPIGKIIANEQRQCMDFKRLLAANGYMEVVTWSFMDSKKAALFQDLKEELTLQNPISSDLNYMRPSILPNLLSIARNNINRSHKDLSFFELGPIFRDADNVLPIKFLTAIRIGINVPKNPHFKLEKVSVFDTKSDIELILAHAGIQLDKCTLSESGPSYYHPGRSATIMLGKNIIGHFGQIHPKVAEKFEIDHEVIAFEIDISNLPIPKAKLGKRSEFKSSDYQMVTRDYAFILDEHQPVGVIINYIKNIDKELIKNVILFDIYDGDKITAGKKSIAISVNMQDDNNTLTEEKISKVNHLIISTIETKFGGRLRTT